MATLLLLDNKKVFTSIQYGENRASLRMSSTEDLLKGNNNNTARANDEHDELKTTLPLFPSPSVSPHQRTLDDEVCEFLTQIGWYEAVTKKKNNYMEKKYSEMEMLRDFHGDEVCGRIIYHFIYKGWRPNTKTPEQHWQKKLPGKLSVSELYLFLTARQLRGLASYLNDYRVDGALMKHILQDGILCSQMLHDRSYISREDFQRLCLDFNKENGKKKKKNKKRAIKV